MRDQLEFDLVNICVDCREGVSRWAQAERAGFTIPKGYLKLHNSQVHGALYLDQFESEFDSPGFILKAP